MLKRKKNITSLILSVVMTASLSGAMSTYVSAASSRLAGLDRYETSAAISNSGWTTSDYVVIANGEDYPDALSASPLAKKYNAPILLTSAGALDKNAKKEIERLKPSHAFIIGGNASVSKAAAQEISSLIPNVQRLGGLDRYETSVEVAKALGTVSKIVLTSGNGFADALSIAPVAGKESMPILLTEKDKLPDKVKEYLDGVKDSIEESYVVGGVGVINEGVASKLPTEAVRLSGDDRYETNVEVMAYFSDKIDFSNLYVVKGDGLNGKAFADALSGSALAAKNSSPIVLTDGIVPKNTESFMKFVLGEDSNFIALGGEAVVPQGIITKLEEMKVEKVNLVKQITEEVQKFVNQVNAKIPELATDNEKKVVTKLIDSLSKGISDPNYDLTSELDEYNKLYEQLTDEEKQDISNKLAGIDIGKLQSLLQQAGVL